MSRSRIPILVPHGQSGRDAASLPKLRGRRLRHISESDLLEHNLNFTMSLYERSIARERAQMAVNRRLIRDIEALQSSASGISTDRTFPLMELPPEIRRRIWEFALLGRLLMTGTLHLSSNVLKPPAMAHVCRESRSVALEHGRLRQVGVDEWTWLSSGDTVFSNGHSSNDIDDFYDARLGQLSDVAENVVVSALIDLFEAENFSPCCEDFCVRTKAWRAGQYPRLKTVGIQPIFCESDTDTLAVVDKSWDPYIVDDLFGTSSFVKVDLSNEQEVTGVLDILDRSRTTTRFASALRDVRYMLFDDQFCELGLTPWDHILDFIRTDWVRDEWSRTPLAIQSIKDLVIPANDLPHYNDLGEVAQKLYGNHRMLKTDHPWVRLMLPRMPAVSPVFTFAFSDGRPILEEQPGKLGKFPDLEF